MDLAGARYAQSEKVSSESGEIAFSEDAVNMEHLFAFQRAEIPIEGEDFHFFIYLMALISLGGEVVISELKLICRTESGESGSGDIILFTPGKQRFKKLFAPGEIENELISMRGDHLHTRSVKLQQFFINCRSEVNFVFPLMFEQQSHLLIPSRSSTCPKRCAYRCGRAAGHSSFILAYLGKERINSFFLGQEHPPLHVADLFLFYTAEGSKWYNSGSFIETVAL